MIVYGDFLTSLRGAHQYSHYIAGMCPFHSDNDPSLLVFNDGWFECLGCGRRGSWVTLWNRLKGQPVQVMPDRRMQLTAPIFQGEQVEEVCYRAHDSLMTNPSLGWYLEMRGITSRIEVNELGYWDGWYTIPVRDRDGNFVTGVFRAAPHIQKATGLRYWMRGQSTLYVPDWNALERNGYLYVVFGMIDALVLASMGFPVATSTSGQSRFDPHWLERYRKPIIIIPDKGEEEKAHLLASGLDWRAKVLKLKYPDGVKDPAGYFEKGLGQYLMGDLARETA